MRMRMRKRCIRFLCLSVCPSACVLQPLPCNLSEKNIFSLSGTFPKGKVLGKVFHVFNDVRFCEQTDRLLQDYVDVLEAKP